MSQPIVVVISDLHMGVGALDDFDAEIERHFVSFLREWSRPGAVELIINGDLLDFVQASPFTGPQLESKTAEGVPLCFTEAQSVDKLRVITSQHAEAFEALTGFLRSGPDTRLTILPGNHDADLFWPAVQTALSDRICRQDAGAAARFRIHLDQVYRPPGHEHLWIEHGHQFDPVNAFNVGKKPCWSAHEPPIFNSASGERRLYECVGTRLLIRYMNELDSRYPLVDNVKPFGRFVRIFLASAVLPGYGPLDAAIAAATLIRYLTTTALSRPSDLMEIPSGPPADLDEPLRRAVKGALPHERSAFSAALAQAGFGDGRSPLLMLDDKHALRELSDFLAEHLEILGTLPDQETSGVMELKRGYFADETDDLRKAADGILETPSNGCKYVTMGHTHDAVDDGRYFNTGSWTRYYEYQPGERLRPWSRLREGSYEWFPYSLKLLESHGGTAPDVKLTTFASRHKV